VSPPLPLLHAFSLTTYFINLFYIFCVYCVDFYIYIVGLCGPYKCPSEPFDHFFNNIANDFILCYNTVLCDGNELNQIKLNQTFLSLLCTSVIFFYFFMQLFQCLPHLFDVLSYGFIPFIAK